MRTRRALSVSGRQELHVWDAATGRTVHEDTAAAGDVATSADVVFDGDRLGEIRGDRLTIWDTATWQRDEHELALGDGAVLSPDLRRVTDGRVVTQIETGRTVATRLAWHPPRVQSGLAAGGGRRRGRGDRDP